MKNCILFAFILLIFSYLPAHSAQIIISCSHPELCRVAQIILTENHQPHYEFSTLVHIVGDPHEYEPTTTEIKNLIKADILISGPFELNPWAKKVSYQRAKLVNTKSININYDKNDYALYPNSSHEALSHFWLYPKLFCVIKSKLELEFINQKLLSNPVKNNNCENEKNKIEGDFAQSLKNIQYPIVMTHDALLPFLEKLSSNPKNVVAIKGSGHHQEASPQSVKNLYDALKAKRVIWIEEENIKVPQNILDKKRKDDLVIKLSTDTSNADLNVYFPVLKSLNDKLKAIK